MKGQKKHTVLFDFDGVIADSFSATYALMQKFCAHVTHERFKGGFEGNIHDAFKEWTSEQHGHDCNHAMDWDAEYTSTSRDTVGIFPGIDTAIAELAQRYRLHIVSSGSDECIDSFLRRAGLRDFFEEILGVRVHKSKTEKIKIILSKYNVNAQECVFVTDTLGDMYEAQRVCVDTIGVSWGVHDHATLQKGTPFRIVKDPSDIPPTVGEFFSLSSK